MTRRFIDAAHFLQDPLQTLPTWQETIELFALHKWKRHSDGALPTDEMIHRQGLLKCSDMNILDTSAWSVEDCLEAANGFVQFRADFG
jgi:hypothetical protein